jgi:hypothetical protein
MERQALQIYFHGTPSDAIRGLEELQALLEQQLSEAKRYGANGPHIEMWLGDLSITHGRLALKYEEIGDASRSSAHFQQASEYMTEQHGRSYTRDEVRTLVTRLDQVTLLRANTKSDD